LQDLVDELASPKYEQCYSNITLEHSGFRFQIINGTLFVDHLPWHNYAGGVVDHALTPDPYNVYAPSHAFLLIASCDTAAAQQASC
jgi:hypothetical protein